ncbi:MAG: hypothetical protein KDJ50_01255 [Alphaproteobacteria bacterium]|nr:hypothetical protein [Alphaproteobacteria bacterium]
MSEQKAAELGVEYIENPECIPLQAAMKSKGGRLSHEFEKMANDGKIAEISRLLKNPYMTNVLDNFVLGVGKLGIKIPVKSSEVLLELATADFMRSHPEVKGFGALLKDGLCGSIKKHAFAVENVGEKIDYKGMRMPICLNPYSTGNRIARMILSCVFKRALKGTLNIVHPDVFKNHGVVGDGVLRHYLSGEVAGDCKVKLSSGKLLEIGKDDERDRVWISNNAQRVLEAIPN